MTTLADIQRLVGVTPDGALGPATLAAIARALGMGALSPEMLSPHFSVAEFTASQTAARKGIANAMNAAQRGAAAALCQNILEPVRAHFGRPVRLTSGFRSDALNRAIGGSTTSQHSKGEAADFEVAGVSNHVVAKWIEANLPFDQLILEFYKSGDPNSGWIHCSYRPQGRRQALTTADGRTYAEGLRA